MCNTGDNIERKSDKRNVLGSEADRYKQLSFIESSNFSECS